MAERGPDGKPLKDGNGATGVWSANDGEGAWVDRQGNPHPHHANLMRGGAGNKAGRNLMFDVGAKVRVHDLQST